jgi:hypothetical protein
MYDVVVAPAAGLSALILRMVRREGLQKLPMCRRVLDRTGVYPVLDHYYEPLFRVDRLRHSLRKARDLTGIDWNEAGQLAFLDEFHYVDELHALQDRPPGDRWPDFGHGFFAGGDAEYLYSVIRHFEPKRIIEIGCGQSTLVATAAVTANAAENPTYRCDHLCVDPHGPPWLDELNVVVHRGPVEELPLQAFDVLEPNDLLFIDSTHVIRPQGDVLYELLSVLPRLRPGVVVHVHDIFTPFDYPDAWVRDERRLWNEQYLLEAFLSCNSQFRILGALNFLKHQHYDRLSAKCPFLTPQSEPGSFYFSKTEAAEPFVAARWAGV